MRATQTCPKCRRRKMLVVEEVRQPVTGPSLRPLYAAAAQLDASSAGPGIAAGGRFEAWICAACGFTEWYTKGIEDLVALSTVPDSGVRVVIAEVDDERSPYR